MGSGGGMVDTRDLKSLARKGVWVQVPPGVLRQCGNSSVGRARPCQGRGREFESRFPLEHDLAKVGVASSSLVFRSTRESFEIMNDNIKVHVQNAL